MPTYEYKCEKCEDLHEVVRSMSDPSPSTLDCGLCGGVLRRVWGFNNPRSGQEMPPERR